MKKRLLTLILAGVLACSLTACGGEKEPEAADVAETTVATSENTETSATLSETQEIVDEDKSEKSSVMVYYGWTNDGEEKYTSEIFLPEGAAFSEKTLQINEEDGSVMTVEVDDEINEYSATSRMYWHRDAYNGEPAVYPIVAQLYFDGELDAETAAEHSNCSQTITPLGFKWNGYDVILIETKYTFGDYGEQTDFFAGVEYDLDYWRNEVGTGKVMNLTTKGLFGFDMHSYGWDELTQDKCKWIIGELFGVDSGVANPFAVSTEVVTVAVDNVDAFELLGTWFERDSAWNNKYIFNADGTGVLISGPEYLFTFTADGDVLTLTYDDGYIETFTISVNGGVLTMIDKFGNEIILDKQGEEVAEEFEEPEESEPVVEADSGNPYVKEVIGTWVDEESGYQETFTFKADGTGMYSYVDGGLYELPLTYDFLRSDYIEFFCEDGTEGGFVIKIEGDTMYVTNDLVVDMPLVRQ